jgi:hypothetical protein
MQSSGAPFIQRLEVVGFLAKNRNAVVDGGIPPDIRVWFCENCQTWHLHDENSGRHGLKRTLEKLVPGSGQRAVPVIARCTWRVTPTGVRVLPGGAAV